MAAMTPTTVIQDLIAEDLDTGGPCSDVKFKARADIKEGVSGRHPIDSTYENTDYELLHGEDCPMK
jgi:hypothetical protein